MWRSGSGAARARCLAIRRRMPIRMAMAWRSSWRCVSRGSRRPVPVGCSTTTSASTTRRWGGTRRVIRLGCWEESVRTTTLKHARPVTWTARAFRPPQRASPCGPSRSRDMSGPAGISNMTPTIQISTAVATADHTSTLTGLLNRLWRGSCPMPAECCRCSSHSGCRMKRQQIQLIVLPSEGFQPRESRTLGWIIRTARVQDTMVKMELRSSILIEVMIMVRGIPMSTNG